MLIVQDQSTPSARERAVAHFTHIKHGVSVHLDKKKKKKAATAIYKFHISQYRKLQTHNLRPPKL